MKKLLAVASVGLLFTGCATMVPESAPENLTRYERVIDIPNTNKKEIFEGSKQWFAKSFKNSNSVIKYENLETGSIIGKGNMPYGCDMGEVACALLETDRSKRTLEFTVKVDAKDNRARVIFEDLVRTTPGGLTSAGMRTPATTTNIRLQSEVTQVKNMLDDTIDSLADDIKTTTSSADW